VSSFAIASVVFGYSFGAALVGMVLHANYQTVIWTQNHGMS
jgi:hypothetical protein